jgi:hypothetical protein
MHMHMLKLCNKKSTLKKSVRLYRIEHEGAAKAGVR